MKSWCLIPIVKVEVSLHPNMPNIDLKALLKDYVKEIFLTPSLLQQMKKAMCMQVFGDVDINVKYVPALERLLKALGHDFEIFLREKDDVLCNCEVIALIQHISLIKSDGNKLQCADKIEYLKQWKSKNNSMLQECGLISGCL